MPSSIRIPFGPSCSASVRVYEMTAAFAAAYAARNGVASIPAIDDVLHTAPSATIRGTISLDTM